MKKDFSQFLGRNDHLNTLQEEFVFMDYNLQKLDGLFYPVLAGISHKDPEYYNRRGARDSYNPYLYVFEYVRSGKGYIENRGITYTVKKGDFFIINTNNQPYCYSDKEDPYEKIWLNVCGGFVNALMYAYHISDPIFILHMDADPYLQRIHRELENYRFDDLQGSNLRVMQVILELFHEIGRTRAALEKSQKKGSREIAVDSKHNSAERIADYIRLNIISDALTVHNLCSIFYISEWSMRRMFLKSFGVTPIRYITEQKVAYARHLLVTTDFTVERISEQLNFANSGYFRKIFCSVCGVTPSQYRKNETKNRLRKI